MRYRNVLLIDDDEDDQEIFLSALQSVATQVHCQTATGGHEALKKLVDGTVKPDLILLDLNMPRMNGTQFLQELKRADNLQRIPVIIMSTSANPATIEQTRQLGAIDFMTKPDSFAELTSMLQKLLA